MRLSVQSVERRVLHVNTDSRKVAMTDLKAGDKVKVDCERLDDVLKIRVTRDS